MIPRRSLARAGLLGIAFLAGCKVDQAAFDNRIFACDPSAKDPGCGSDPSGNPMVCYPASQLDGTDFCAPSCDTVMSLPDGTQCVEGGAELPFCKPSVPNSCGQSALGCLRTDVTTDQGVCTTMIPCTEDKDCKDPVRSTCAATFLTQLYSQNTTLKANNLYCLQKNCQSGASSCSPGQSCLPLLVPAAAHAPDICVPNCDSASNCPPNHVCFQKISGPANPAICIPGLLGFICETDINCLVGKCLSDGDPDADNGLKLCTLKCNSDADCATFDSDQGTFACVMRADGQSYCESPYSYRGNSCRTTADCTRDENTICVFQTPPEKSTDLGTCLRPCTTAPGQTTPDCAPRAEIGQTPLPFYTVAAPGSAATPTTACFPGSFALPCESDANCFRLNCRGAKPGVPGSGNCTDFCATDSDPTDPDADCHKNAWIGQPSFCATPANAPTGLCAPLIADGKPCQSANQCQSKICQPAPDGGASSAGTCAGAAE